MSDEPINPEQADKDLGTIVENDEKDRKGVGDKKIGVGDGAYLPKTREQSDDATGPGGWYHSSDGGNF